MRADRSQRVTEIFKLVLEAPPTERATRLDRACAGDPELRSQVEDLLLAGERAWDDEHRGEEEMPARIGKYEIVARIGRGGFGEVFLGRDPVIKRDVAVKLCTSENEALQQRFFRETEIVGRLKHSNITMVHDSGSFNEVPYMVQEYLPGEDLAHLIRSRRRIPPAKRLDFLVQIARGLEYAHEMGVIHRDVKPSNIRVLEDGTVKILDFGVARLVDAKTRLTKTGIRIGTECYMAPEQLCGEPVDARADVFSFGVVAYELLTYVHPFKAEHGPAMIYKVMEGEPAPITDLWPSCPPRLDDGIAHCLEKDPEARPDGMGEVIEELERVELPADAASAPTGVTLVRAAGRTARRRRKRRGPWRNRVATAAVAVVLGVAAFFVAREVVGPKTVGPRAAESTPEPADDRAETDAVPVEPSPREPAEETAPTRTEPDVERSESPTAESRADTGDAGTVEAPEPEVPEMKVLELNASVRTKPPGTVESMEVSPVVVAPEPDDVAEQPASEQLPAEDLPVESTAAVEPAVPPPAPDPGTLVINALPWASLVRIVGTESSQAVATPSPYTPLAFAVPPGRYTVELSGSGVSRRCEVEVESGSPASCLVELTHVKARSFFARDQPDSGRGGPAPFPPGGPVRGDPRGFGPPRNEPSRPGAGGPPPRRDKVPGWIRDAAQAYFDGDYETALTRLAEDSAKKKLPRFYVRLFQGASRYSLYLLSAEQDSSLVEAAIEDLRYCRRDRPSFVPHPDFFSPRFIELFSVAAAP